MTKYIKNLVAGNYSSPYEVPGEKYTVSGNLQTDGQKRLTNISGQVKDGQVMVASFNAFKNGDGLRYSFNVVRDIDDLGAISAAVKVAVAGVEAELAE